jgi:hypothetical protein
MWLARNSFAVEEGAFLLLIMKGPSGTFHGHPNMIQAPSQYPILVQVAISGECKPSAGFP